MKLLNGSELAGFIKERQAKEVRRLVQAEGIRPKLAIIKVSDDPVINTYVRLKEKYGADIGVEVVVYQIDQSDVQQILGTLNEDDSVTGIIVQLPLVNRDETQEVLNMVVAAKDVDGLRQNSPFDPATPIAISWLLAGYNVELRGKHILIIGQGPLVGAPLARMLEASELNVETVNREVQNLSEITKRADVIVTATGNPGLITAEMLNPGTVVVDAGSADEQGTVKGDLASNVYQLDDLIVTPRRGGVGPLTVAALFDNLLRATRTAAEATAVT